MARATEPPHQVRVPTNKLQALIEAHMTAYFAFVRAVHEMGGSSGDCDTASREEAALLGVCAYPAVSKSDRFAKARYLLEIEARGELDLPKHMQSSSSLDDVEDMMPTTPISLSDQPKPFG
ncbi:hypothetical protein [Mesorhizobium sp. Arg314]